MGRLKVSFFGPFYGGYNILVLDRDYSHALVCGPSRKYLWILARRPKMEETVKAGLVEKAGSLGFDTSKLIFVETLEQVSSREDGSMDVRTVTCVYFSPTGTTGKIAGSISR